MQHNWDYFRWEYLSLYFSVVRQDENGILTLFSSRFRQWSLFLYVFTDDSVVDLMETQQREKNTPNDHHLKKSEFDEIRIGSYTNTNTNTTSQSIWNGMEWKDENEKWKKCVVTQWNNIWESEKLLCIQTSYIENGRTLKCMAIKLSRHWSHSMILPDSRRPESLPHWFLSKCVQCTSDH